MSAVGTRESELAAFVDQLVAELAPLEKRHNEEYWLANVTGEARHEQESARLDTQMRKIFARREPYRKLLALAEGGPLTDALLDRQLRLLLNGYRAKQISPETIEKTVALEKALESRFNNHRAQVGGKALSDNQILEVLRESNDSAERRAAWEGSKQIGAAVEADLLELVRVRNESAVELGFSNYYSMAMELDELDEQELFELLDKLDAGTRPLWEAYKGDLDRRLAQRFGVRVEDLRPWHYADPFFQEAPAAEIDLDPFYAGRNLEELTERFFRAVGFEIRDLLERSDLYEKPGKCHRVLHLGRPRQRRRARAVQHPPEREVDGHDAARRAPCTTSTWNARCRGCFARTSHPSTRQPRCCSAARRRTRRGCARTRRDPAELARTATPSRAPCASSCWCRHAGSW